MEPPSYDVKLNISTLSAPVVISGPAPPAQSILVPLLTIVDQTKFRVVVVEPCTIFITKFETMLEVASGLDIVNVTQFPVSPSKSISKNFPVDKSTVTTVVPTVEVPIFSVTPLSNAI